MSNEQTLMTDPAATTPEGEPASQPTEQHAATGAEADGQQQQPAGTPPTGEQAQGEQPADGQGDEQEGKPEGAPEQYDFQAPKGYELDTAVVDQFAEVAKELGLTQDAAQKVLDKMAPAMAERQLEQLQAARQQWAADAKADQEFGGDKLDENLAVAKKAMDTFATPELRTLLNESGLGNHPEVIRVFVRVGKTISEDSVVRGASGAAGPVDSAKVLFPSMKN